MVSDMPFRLCDNRRVDHCTGCSRLLKRINQYSSLAFLLLLLLLSERTPLERCCVHNMSPFVSSSGLSPGSREDKVQRAKVCLNCTEPSVARSSYWSLPVAR